MSWPCSGKKIWQAKTPDEWDCSLYTPQNETKLVADITSHSLSARSYSDLEWPSPKLHFWWDSSCESNRMWYVKRRRKSTQGCTSAVIPSLYRVETLNIHRKLNNRPNGPQWSVRPIIPFNVRHSASHTGNYRIVQRWSCQVLRKTFKMFRHPPNNTLRQKIWTGRSQNLAGLFLDHIVHFQENTFSCIAHVCRDDDKRRKWPPSRWNPEHPVIIGWKPRITPQGWRQMTALSKTCRED